MAQGYISKSMKCQVPAAHGSIECKELLTLSWESTAQQAIVYCRIRQAAFAVSRTMSYVREAGCEATSSSCYLEMKTGFTPS